MKILIAIDSYKGSMSSMEAGREVQRAAQAVWKEEAETVVFPLADGGEGTMETLTEGLLGEKKRIKVTGPLGEQVEADYGIVREQQLAVMEMAQAAGLTLVPKERRNPLHTTTYGVGEMILDALEEGCRQFLIGIGGSATNDGGLGMLTALGVKCLDEKGQAVGIFGADMLRVAAVDTSGIDRRLQECEFQIACDVKNPLCGEQGCSAVFGPQKGASPQIVAEMDVGLERFGRLAEQSKFTEQQAFASRQQELTSHQVLRSSRRNIMDQPGSGAAGGLGFAFWAFCSAELAPGAELVQELLGLEQEAADADLLITGEGRMDAQTVMGKGPAAIAALGQKYKIPVIGLAGSLAAEEEKLQKAGFTAVFSIAQGACSLEEAMEKENARHNLYRTAEQVLRLYHCAMENT